jgi:protein ImuA
MSDHAGRLAAVRAKIAAIEAGGRMDSESLSLGTAAIDACLPGGGLPLGRWHEITGEGMETETAAAPAAFAALMAAPLARRGEAVWVMRCDDLFAPGLAGLGFPAERLICVASRSEAETLAVMEDALSTRGVSAVLGEVDVVDLTAGRRLQLACEKRGATGFVVRRRPYGGPAGKMAGRSAGTETGSAAATRWRVASASSQTPAGEFGLGAPRWRASLERSRGGRPGEWLLEAHDAYSWERTDGTHPLRLVADLGDRQLAPAQPLRRAG